MNRQVKSEPSMEQEMTTDELIEYLINLKKDLTRRIVGIMNRKRSRVYNRIKRGKVINHDDFKEADKKDDELLEETKALRKEVMQAITEAKIQKLEEEGSVDYNGLYFQRHKEEILKRKRECYNAIRTNNC